MNTRTRQFGNLTGTPRFQYHPQENIVQSVQDEEFMLLSIGEAKTFLGVKTDAYDVYIERLIKGVTYLLERYTAKDTQPKVRLAYWSRPNFMVKLPVTPVNSIVSVKEVLPDGTKKDIPGSGYDIVGIEHIALRFHVQPQALEVVYNCGYEKPPEPYRAALLQEVALQYKNRQDPSQPGSPDVGGLSVEARHMLISSGLYDYAL